MSVAPRPSSASFRDPSTRLEHVVAAFEDAWRRGERPAIDAYPGQLDDSQRAHWRKQALAWLQADLALRAKQLEQPTPQAVSLVRLKLQRLQQDAALAGLRDKAALAKLSDEEQAACRKLWADVEILLKKTQGKAK
jgi:hypothetical protein